MGTSNGVVKVISMESFRVLNSFKIFLDEGEELTAACMNPNGVNLAIGTSQGNIYFGALKPDGLSLGKLEELTCTSSITSL
jgi:hypothetical protein